LHIARTPFTGVWSVIKALATYQQNQLGMQVGIGIFSYPRWETQYGRQFDALEKIGVKIFRAQIPDWPYTLLFPFLNLTYRVVKSPIIGWLNSFCNGTANRRQILHFHNAWLSGGFVPVNLNGHKPGLVATYHGIQGAPQLRASRLKRHVHRWLARRFIHHGGLLASVDDENPRVAYELFGIKPDHFTVIPNGIMQTNDVKPAAFPTDLPVIGHVGTINEGKGWRLTAEAVQNLRKKGCEVRFVVAGDGPEAIAAKSWCRRHNTFAHFLGHVPDAAQAVTPHLTLFVLPSRSEGCPMAAVEALASGVPVIGTCISGMKQIIDDGLSGMFVERNPENIAMVIEKIICNTGLLNTLKTGAIKHFYKNYHISQTADAYNNLYRKALTN
jgi:glycosyltransferase involved in cell wall biosynthesis